MLEKLTLIWRAIKQTAKILFFVSAIGVSVYYAIYLVFQDVDTGAVVEIEMPHNTLPSLFLEMPQKYFGYRFLALVKKNLKGGRQHWVVLRLGYPSMEPWNEEASPVRGDTEIMVVIQGRSNSGLNKYWKSIRSRYEYVGMSEFGLDEYEYPEESIFSKIPERYFVKYSDDGDVDSIVICQKSNGHGIKCRSDLVTHKTNVSVEFTFLKNIMNKWPDLAKRIEKFVESTVVEVN